MTADPFESPGVDEYVHSVARSRRATAERDARHAYLAAYDRAWNRRQPAPTRDQGWRRSVDRFRAEGLAVDVMLELVDVALEREGIAPRDRWRYFVGCCWRRLEQDRGA